MVVNINQVSSNVSTSKSANQTTSEPAESFQTVLMNAGTSSTDVNDPITKGQVSENNVPVDETAKMEQASAFVSDAIVSNVQMEIVNMENEIIDKRLDAITDTIANLYPEVEVLVSELQEYETVPSDDNTIIPQLETTIDTAFNEVISELESTVVFETGKVLERNVETVEQDNLSDVNIESPVLHAAENTVRTVNQNSSTVNVSKEANEEIEELSTQFSTKQIGSDVTTFEASSEIVLQSSAATHVVEKVSDFENYVSNPVALQVIDKIADNFESVSTFKNEISFVLNPASLGRVAVRMVVERGTLTVELSASSKTTQNILAENLESIKEVLRNLSIDNQVNEVMNHTQDNYLEDRDNQNSQGSNEEQSDNENNDSDNHYTEDFLSILTLMNSEEI
ncbi:MAG: flagellar hook-length control protein FliK [Oscillospiraceae bacterium]|nr:flagellar hook-length control protein FliK [Oscillospiraceae bacterium]